MCNVIPANAKTCAGSWERCSHRNRGHLFPSALLCLGMTPGSVAAWLEDEANMARTVEMKDDYFIMPLSHTTLDQLGLPFLCGGINSITLYCCLQPMNSILFYSIKSHVHLSVLLLTRIYRIIDTLTNFSLLEICGVF